MDLTLDDLIGKCDACGGTGKRLREPEGESGGTYGRRVVTSYPLGFSPEECVGCAGTGRRRLTATGRAIVDLFTVVNGYNAKGRIGMLLHEDRDSSAT